MSLEAIRPKAPPPPIAPEEFEQRCEHARTLMAQAQLDAMLVCTELNVRYFTGFSTQFWASPTRPWFFVLPRWGRPFAVIPEIGQENFLQTSWVEDLLTWPSPRPEDEGVSLVVDALKAIPRTFGRVGMEFGTETHLRIPVSDFRRIAASLPQVTFADAVPLIRRLRNLKSPAEVARIRYVAQLVCDVFDGMPGWAKAGMTEREIVRRFQAEAILRGADRAPYMIARSGNPGPENIIMGPTDKTVAPGDVFILDTGCVYDGYFCDFDRNVAFGKASDAAKRAYVTVWQATEEAIKAARPGAKVSDVWRVMNKVIEAAGATNAGVGRMGHGLGLALTEWPSLMGGDDQVIEPNMVLTIEPGMEFAPNALMVHEENLLVTPDGPQLLTRRAPPELPVIK